MSTKNLTSIIIVNYNGAKWLKQCLDSLFSQTDKKFEVIFVDNASVDKSVEYVKGNYPNVLIAQNRENFGFAGGNNVGLKKTKGEYILLLNNDTKVAPDFLEKLLEVFGKDKKVAVVQPKIVFMDSGKLQAGGSFLTNFGFLYHYGFGKNPNSKEYNEPMEIFSANGACMLIKREVIEKVGLFDSDFFAYFEETDFCWRVWLAGFKVLYQPKAVVYHAGAKTASRFESPFINFHSFKNRICSLIKNLGTKELIKILPLHVLVVEGFSFFQLIKFKPKMFWALQKALFWNLKNLRRTLEKRAFVQKSIRALPDTKLMPKIKRKVRLSYFYYLITGVAKYKD